MNDAMDPTLTTAALLEERHRLVMAAIEDVRRELREKLAANHHEIVEVRAELAPLTRGRSILIGVIGVLLTIGGAIIWAADWLRAHITFH